MTCQEFSDTIPDYITHALTPGGARDLELHATACATCRDELRATQEAASLVWLTAPQVPPPQALRARVLAAAQVDSTPLVTPQPRWRMTIAQAALGLSAAAVCLALGVGAWAWSLQGELSRQATDSARLREQLGRQRDAIYVLMSPTLVERPLQGSEAAPQARGRVYLDPPRRQGMLVASELPVLEPDRTYQVWLRGKDGVMSAGVLRVDDRGTGYAILDPSVPLDQFETVGISIEPLGGSPQPTGPRMMLGSL